MRRHLAALAGAVLVASVLAGCGDDAGTTATDPGPSPSTPDPGQSADQPSEEPVSVRKTCAELYHPPAQLMPRAIEFVHSSPAAEDSSQAEELVTGLDLARGRALGPLAEDVAVVREAVEAQRAAAESGSEGPEVAPFDAAANRLARHCEIYND